MQNKNSKQIKLCLLEDIPQGGARSYVIDHNDLQIHLFIVRKGTGIHTYENRCPHMGTSLDWSPDQFLDSSNSLIQCATHGALFRIEDGLCIQGPCVNQHLTAIKAEILDKFVVVKYPDN
jgi:nitrite reductase/ring-hydroxylating ferredoxin subunit